MKRERQKQLQLASNADASSERPQPLTTTSLILDRTHPLSDLYYKRASYKVYWGGRGSAKSWGVAEALIRTASERCVRVMCCREIQDSIKDSSHKILVDTIARLGLQSWFHVTEKSIRSKTGSEFFFKGLHNNENGIRSVEGVDICWVEEAHSVSELSWRSLLPTIRKEDAEVWITFNMASEDDATFRRFVGTLHEAWTLGSNAQPLANPPRTNSIVWKLNYDSNPFFGGKLKQDMEDDKAADYHLYEHVWLGLPLKISAAIILSGKYVVKDFPATLVNAAQRVHLGADFGFAQDPNALIRFFTIENHLWPEEVQSLQANNPDGWDVDTLRSKYGKRRLFIEHEAYGRGVDLDDMPEFYDSVPGAREWHIKADCARPETISHLARRGFQISGAEKWDGSVKDGITHLRGFNQIVIHSRCKYTAEEARLYRYKVDPKTLDAQGQPLVLPVVVDRFNHCWDAIRYGLDGYIQRSGAIGIWERLANPK